MKKFLLASTVLALLGVSYTMSVMAQPPRGDRPEGPPPGGPGERGPGERGPGERGPGRPPMPNPLFAALDKNADGEISADELKEATASLLTLDKNGDGKLTDEETRPPRPERGQPDGPPFFGPPNGGPRGRGPGDGPPGGREGAGRGDGPPGREQGFQNDGPPRGRDGAGRGDGPPPRGPMGPPNPERFVDEAMRFDADGDGKLDKAELLKFAEEMADRRGPPPDDGGRGRGPRRSDGDRPPEGDRPPGDREGGGRERPDAE